MSEISVVVVGSTSINSIVGNGDSVNISVSGSTPNDAVKVNVSDQTFGGGTIQIGTVTILDTTATPTVVNSGTAYVAKLDFGLPRGSVNSLTVGTVATGATAAVSITGNAPSQTISFVIPRGPAGQDGQDGSFSLFRSVQGTPDPADFAINEPAWDSLNGRLFIKSPAGEMVVVSGGTSVTPFLPTPPTNVAVVTTSSYADLTWTASNTLSVLPVTDYVIQYKLQGGEWVTFSDSVSSATTARVTGLTTSSYYQFRVAGKNELGVGDYSTPTGFFPAASPPSAPQSVSASAGELSATLTWQAPASDGGIAISRYEVEFKAEDEITWTPVSRSSPLTLLQYAGSLAGGLRYDFRVRAATNFAVGAWSSIASATPIYYDDLWSDVVLLMNMEGTGAAFTDQSTSATSFTYRFAGGLPTQTSERARRGSKSAQFNGSGYVTIPSGRATTFAGAFTVELWINFPSKPARAMNILHVPGRGGPQLTLRTAANGQGLNYGRGYVRDYGSSPATFEANRWYHIAAVRGSDYIVQMFVDGRRITQDGVLDNAGGVTSLSGALAIAPSLGVIGATCYVDDLRFTTQARYAADFTPSRGAFPTAPRPGAPSAPRQLTATPSDSALTLAWSVPSSSGGYPIDAYRVEYRALGDDWELFADNVLASPVTITSLTNGGIYEARVAAVSQAGRGEWATTALIGVAALAGKVTGLAGTSGHNQLCLSWSEPSDGGLEITDYLIETNSGAGWVAFSHAASPITSTTVTGLVNNTSYQVRVSAITAIGTGPASDPITLTPTLILPAAPTGLSAVASDSAVVVSWNPPSAISCATVTKYILSYSGNGGASWFDFAPQAIGAASQRVSGLTNGTAYVFRLAFQTAAGNGDWSYTSGVTPNGAPGMPGAINVTVGSEQATLTWTAADPNGAAITDYIIQYQAAGGRWEQLDDGVGVGTTFTVGGLVNGTSYTFRIAARNSNGDSVPRESSSVTIVGPAAAPTGLSVVAASRQATLTWTAPANNGGSAILNYTVGYTRSGQAEVTAVVAGTPTTIASLLNGQTYSFRVRANTGFGAGNWSTASTIAITGLPDAPTGLSATPASGQATLAWTPPADNGGDAIIRYDIEYTPAGGAAQTTTASASPKVVTGLTNGTSHSFRVRAVNSVGNGAYTSPVVATVAGVPDAVSGVSVTVASGSASVSWSTPNSNGATITNYTVEFTPSGGSPQTRTATQSPLSITGLVNGTTYSFRVRANNVIGNGEYSSSASATVAGTPGAPTSLAGVANAPNQIALSWTAPADTGGLAITGYRITRNGSVTLDVSGTTATVGALQAGTSYSFTVAAQNSLGYGTPSAAINVTAAAAPQTPAAPTVGTDYRQAVVSWSAPSNNGAAISSYTVEYTPSGGATQSVTTPNLSATISNLTNGTTYTFRVSATNSAGTGTFSATTSALVSGVPRAPTGLTITTINSSKIVDASWTAPADNGGQSIIDYTLQFSADGSVYTTAATPLQTFSGFAVPNYGTYSARVLARNVKGSGAYSAVVQFTTKDIPAKVPSVSATAGNAQASLSWAAPSMNGGTLQSYTIRRNGSAIATTTSLSYIATGLTNGTAYAFSIYATNEVGDGIVSDAVNATPVTVPGAPTALSAAGGNTRIDLSWTAPASNGGSAITSYTVEYTPSGGSPVTVSTGSNSTSYPITGLTNGTAYTVRVAAVSAVGTGAYTAASAAVTPAVSSIIQTTPTLYAWYDTSASDTLYSAASGGSLVTANGGVVNRIRDKSSGGRDLKNFFSGTPATLVTSGQNGNNFVLIDNRVSGDSLRTAQVRENNIFNSGNPLTIFAVWRPFSDSSAIIDDVKYSWGDPESGTAVNLSLEQGRARMRAHSTSWVESGSGRTNNWICQRATMNGANSSLAVNGVYQPPAAGLSSSGTPAGMNFNLACGDWRTAGYHQFGEVVFYSSALSAEAASAIETYLMEKWGITPDVSASVTGGTVSTPGDGYTYRTFTSSGTLAISGASLTADVLVVGGGGGGGRSGGGGGGVLHQINQSIAAGSYSVTVAGTVSPNVSGGSSSLGALFTATGGAGGTGFEWGNGGTSGFPTSTSNTAGNAGGAGDMVRQDCDYTGGGGGGAGGAGSTPPCNVQFAGGGAGITVWSNTYGSGGGGVDQSAGANAPANLGRGGSGTASRGGSGVVIIRYLAT
jgi:titin